MIGVCKAAVKVAAVFLVLCLARAHADPIPGSTAVVDPFNFMFNDLGNASYQVTNNGTLTGVTGTSSGTLTQGSGIGPLVTYQLPNPVSAGDVAVINPAVLADHGLPLDTISNPDGSFLIPASEAALGLFSDGLRFVTVGTGPSVQSYLQFYFSPSGTPNFPSGFAESFIQSGNSYVLAVPGTAEPDGSVGFTFHSSPGTFADNVYFEPPSAVPEPCRSIAFLGLLGMGLIGMVWRWRNQGFFRF